MGSHSLGLMTLSVSPFVYYFLNLWLALLLCENQEILLASHDMKLMNVKLFSKNGLKQQVLAHMWAFRMLTTEQTLV